MLNHLTRSCFLHTTSCPSNPSPLHPSFFSPIEIEIETIIIIMYNSAFNHLQQSQGAGTYGENEWNRDAIAAAVQVDRLSNPGNIGAVNDNRNNYPASSLSPSATARKPPVVAPTRSEFKPRVIHNSYLKSKPKSTTVSSFFHYFDHTQVLILLLTQPLLCYSTV